MTNISNYIIVALVSYLIGSVHPSYIIGKVVGNFDIRSQGSNNAGASNVTFVLGWKWGIITAFVDVMKGLVTVHYIHYISEWNVNLAYLSYMFVIFGHIFPFYMGFKGGKGLATSMGAYGGITVPGTLILLVILIGVTVITGYIGLATITVAVLMFIRTVYVYGFMSVPTLLNGIVMVVILLKHAVNIKRLIKGEEVSLWMTIKKHSKKSIDTVEDTKNNKEENA
ncbi:MAG: glycerol-3-phosphate acyltransferase [Eubacteriaceae bacterium]|nr:glycerol-3-phosphate acyltransferase [Eubacteriaceae bacterium]